MIDLPGSVPWTRSRDGIPPALSPDDQTQLVPLKKFCDFLLEVCPLKIDRFLDPFLEQQQLLLLVVIELGPSRIPSTYGTSSGPSRPFEVSTGRAARGESLRRIEVRRMSGRACRN